MYTSFQFHSTKIHCIITRWKVSGTPGQIQLHPLEGKRGTWLSEFATRPTIILIWILEKGLEQRKGVIISFARLRRLLGIGGV